MKIIHTADWHIGKVLHKHALHDEMVAFFDWLLELIESQKADVLLVSGDVFDLANPGAKERSMYYDFLSRLIATDIHVVITGGNHDGVGVINAPKEVLNALNITVIGGCTNDIKDEIVEIKNKDDEIKLVIAAVPFLRDKDLRNLEEDKKYASRIEAVREGIKTHYKRIGEICKRDYKDTPAIAMGHLYAKGAVTTDSERDIHIGNAAAVESSIFPNCFEYVALGHIHRPQIIGGNDMIRYSGSPIPLSFSEREDKKGILLIEIDNGAMSSPEFIEVPKQRELRKFSGDLSSITSQLEEYSPSYALPSFVELAFSEEAFSSVVLAEIESLVSKYDNHDTFQILKSKTQFKSGAKDTADLFEEGEHIEDLTPLQVFKKKVDDEELSEEQSNLMIESFAELLEIVQSEEV